MVKMRMMGEKAAGSDRGEETGAEHGHSTEGQVVPAESPSVCASFDIMVPCAFLLSITSRMTMISLLTVGRWEEECRLGSHCSP